ncbi:MAG: hypothetical protein WBW88_15010 [Rhodothermales bacterium]
MATVRGFVHQIEVGRAGLVRVQLLQQDGSMGAYVIEDLDADPERFNERLSKLAVLRDAMNRAEPVEIEFSSSEHGNGIDRAVRVSRDNLRSAGSLSELMGFVSDIELHANNRAVADGEQSDIARIGILSQTLQETKVVLDMQIPERAVAVQQLEMLRDAQARGLVVRLLVQSDSVEDHSSEPSIAGVAIVDQSESDAELGQPVDGFVESVHAGPLRSFSIVGMTTAPTFSGPGNTVALTPFLPELVHLLVAKNSRAYELFEAGLRDNLRMHVSAVGIRRSKTDREAAGTRANDEARRVDDTGGTTDADATRILESRVVGMVEVGSAESAESKLGLVTGAQILAPLASASRPVWIIISRKSLDHGPEGFDCTEGIPSSDLKPQTLRDLRIPYPAVWTGIGCFNPGVYRFQLSLPTEFKIFVDDEELCLHQSDDAEVIMAHACMGGEHEVRVEIASWICDYEFKMDVYQLR